MMGECESCFEKQAELECVVDGQYKDLCRNCSLLEGAVVVEKPSNAGVQESWKWNRPTVKEILNRMAGIEEKKPSKNPSMESNLRNLTRPRQADVQVKNFDDSIARFAPKPAESPSPLPWYKKLFGGKSNTPDPNEQPRVNPDGRLWEKEKVKKVHVVGFEEKMKQQEFVDI